MSGIGEKRGWVDLKPEGVSTSARSSCSSRRWCVVVWIEPLLVVDGLLAEDMPHERTTPSVSRQEVQVAGCEEKVGFKS